MRERTGRRQPVSLIRNHPMVRVRLASGQQPVVLDVQECSAHLSPGEALSLYGDLDKLLRQQGFLS